MEPEDILCACDFDSKAAPIVAYAYSLACEHQATFKLPHVENPGQKYQEGDLLELEKALARILPGGLTPVHSLWTLVSDSSPDSAIVDLAVERNSDLPMRHVRL